MIRFTSFSLPAMVPIALAAFLVAGCAAPTPSPSPFPTRPAIAPYPTPRATPAPAVVCEDPAARRTTLTCDRAVAAARAVLPSDTEIVSIEFHYGFAQVCPPGARCAAPSPNRGYVLFRVAGPEGDLVVGVLADNSGTVSAGIPQAAATAG